MLDRNCVSLCERVLGYKYDFTTNSIIAPVQEYNKSEEPNSKRAKIDIVASNVTTNQVPKPQPHAYMSPQKSNSAVEQIFRSVEGIDREIKMLFHRDNSEDNTTKTAVKRFFARFKTISKVEYLKTKGMTALLSGGVDVSDDYVNACCIIYVTAILKYKLSGL